MRERIQGKNLSMVTSQPLPGVPFETALLVFARRWLAWAALLLVSTYGAAHAGIVQRVEKDGTVTYVNVPDGTRAAPTATGSAPAYRKGRPPKAVSKYQALLREAARKYRLSIALLQAVLETESAGNPGAISHAGAEGLMQLIPKTQSRMGVVDPFDPRESVMGGARYLRELGDRFDENVVLMIAAYHAGERAVEGAGYRVPHFPTTRQYVATVLRRYYRAKARAAERGRGAKPKKKKQPKRDKD